MQNRLREAPESWRGHVTLLVSLSRLLAASLILLLGRPAQATVQVLPEMVLKRDGQNITGTKAVRADATLKEVLPAFDRAETALQKKDLGALMQFYASGYNYHGLHLADVERIWGEVFEHYGALSSTHLFSEMKVVRIGEGLRVELTCTGGLYGTEMQSGSRVTLDSWFQEVHYLVRDQSGWRFLGNKGDAPRSAPFSSSPHHPLF